MAGLEDELRLATERLESALQKLIDYESEIRFLRARLQEERCRCRNERQSSSGQDASQNSLQTPEATVDGPNVSCFESCVDHARRPSSIVERGVSPGRFRRRLASDAISFGIIGTGPVGCAVAIDSLDRGLEPVVYALQGHRGVYDAIGRTGILVSVGKIEGNFRPKIAKTLDAMVQAVKVIVVTVPSPGHAEVLEELAQFDLRQRTVVFVPGNNVTPLARQRLTAACIVEVSTSPYGVRFAQEETFNVNVNIKGIKTCLPASYLSTIEGQAIDSIVLSQLEAIFPGRLDWHNSLELAFMNLSMVIHVAPAIMNAGRIESATEDWNYYRDGMTESVAKIQEAIDVERVAAAKAFGINVPTALTMLNKWYGTRFNSMREFAVGTVSHNLTRGVPCDLRHRYITQDVPYGLVPLYEFGTLAGMPMEAVKSLIVMASRANSTDYMKTGRNLRALGLKGLSVSQIMKVYGVKS